jgi:hypothetical protein
MMRSKRISPISCLLALTVFLFPFFLTPLQAAAQPNTLPESRVGLVNFAPPDQLTPDLAIISIEPPIASPGVTTTITVRVTNHTLGTTPPLTAGLGISATRVNSRADLESWLGGEVDPTIQIFKQVEVPELLPAHTTDVSFPFETSEVARLDDQRGPRRLFVSLNSEAELLSHVNSFFIWDPGSTANPVSLSFIAPITGVMGQIATKPYAPEPFGLVARYGQFGAVVQASRLFATIANNDAALSLAVDPILVARTPDDDDIAKQEWLASLENAAAAGVPIHPLPAYDLDFAALAHAGLTEAEISLLLAQAWPQGFTAPANWRTPLAWPVDHLIPDRVTVNAIAQHFSLMVNPAGRRAEWGTITGLDFLPSSQGGLSVLLNDDRLANSFTAATSSRALARNQVESLQYFLADLVVVSEQNPGRPPHLLIALPRDWHPDSGAATRAFTTLVNSGFAVVLSVNALLNQAVPTETRVNWPANVTHQGELPPVDVRRISESLQNLQGPLSASIHPEVIAEAADALILPLSLAWREYYLGGTSLQNPEGIPAAEFRTETIDHAIASVTDAVGAVGLSGTGLTLISDSGLVPLNVYNHLPSDAVFRVVMTPADSRLVVDDEPVVLVPQGVTQLVYVPVRAIASGDVSVSVQLLSESGVVLAQLENLELRIRAGWETAATGVAAGLLGLLLVTGIVRTVRRGRASSRTTAATVGDPKITDNYL